MDSSALLSIAGEEPGFQTFLEIITDASVCRISAGTLLETMIVIDARSDAVGRNKFDEFIQVAGIIVEPVTEEHARIGRAAYRDFGKGSQHPAQLNYGDCFAYALAKTSGEPLLFKGDDFSQTDIRPAI